MHREGSRPRDLQPPEDVAMNLPESLRTVLKEKYADFNGRASRSEYWWFYLSMFVYGLVVGLVAAMLGIGGEDGPDVAILVAMLPFLIPSFAAGARRLHDTGLSGWWQLLGIVPLLGFVTMIVLMARAGQPGPNRFGEPPAETAPSTVAA
jgi:uncharacterized membrane protein YhaH (DUF805 family)